VYDVRIPDAPARVRVFARFAESPVSTTGARSVFLRIDPAGRSPAT
jgi:hypothetical protein